MKTTIASLTTNHAVSRQSSSFLGFLPGSAVGAGAVGTAAGTGSGVVTSGVSVMGRGLRMRADARQGGALP